MLARDWHPTGPITRHPMIVFTPGPRRLRPVRRGGPCLPRLTGLPRPGRPCLHRRHRRPALGLQRKAGAPSTRHLGSQVPAPGAVGRRGRGARAIAGTSRPCCRAGPLRCCCTYLFRCWWWRSARRWACCCTACARSRGRLGVLRGGGKSRTARAAPAPAQKVGLQEAGIRIWMMAARHVPRIGTCRRA